MARRRRIETRKVLPDPKYKEELITKFVNCMMVDGKKAAAEKAMYNALDIIAKQNLDPLATFKDAVENAKPILEVKSRRVGGSNYQVPVEVRPARRQALAIKWIIEVSRARSGQSLYEKLAAELVDCANKRGATMKRREDVHKMAEANKAFAHYRW